MRPFRRHCVDCEQIDDIGRGKVRARRYEATLHPVVLGKDL